MVKGISRQVIVVNPQGEELFDQAIFILKDAAVATGVTDEMLLRQARQLIRSPGRHGKRSLKLYGPVWAGAGAAAMGLIWLLTAML